MDRYLLYEAASALVALVTSRAPLVLVLDDLQWADGSTLRLLDHLLRADDTTRLLVLATLRDTEADGGPRVRALLDQLHRERLTDEIVLGGFTMEEVGAVLAAQPATSSSPELAGPLLEATGGNPFFVVEVARAIDEGATSADALALPMTAQALVRSRVERLSDLARNVLVTAALVDRRIDSQLLARVHRLSSDDVAAALDEAVAAGLLDARDQQLTFRHDLVRIELATSLGPASTTARHRTIAEAIRTLAGDNPDPVLDTLAHHFAQAAADGDPHDAVHYARAAGHRAIDRLAHSTAVTRFELGLDALRVAGTDDPVGELALLLDLAEAWRRTGDLAECGQAGRRALELALAVGSASDQRRAVVAAGHGLTGGLGDRELTETVLAIDQVDRRLGDDPAATPDDRALVALTCADIAAELGDEQAMLQRSFEARALAAEAADPVTRVTVIDGTLELVGEREPMADRLALAEELLAEAERAGDAESRLLAHSDARWLHLTAGDLDEARHHAARYEALATELDMPRYNAGVAQRRAMGSILAGRFAEAEAYAAEMLEHRPDVEFLEGYLAQIAMIRLEQGQVEELAAMLASFDTSRRPGWAAAAALVAAECGQVDDARSRLVQVRRELARHPRDMTWLTTFALAARTAVELGDVDAGTAIADGMAPHADRIVVAGTGAVCFGPVSSYLGLVAGLDGDLVAADAWFDRAEPTVRALGATVVEARTALWRSELLARLGGADREHEARRLLVEGLATAERIGLGGRLVDRARVRIADLGRS